MNSLKEVNVKNRMHYFFDHIINIENLDQNKTKMNENLFKNILIY